MKAKPIKLINGKVVQCKPDEATHIILHMPGPLPTRIIPIANGDWTWNNDIDKPTIQPSILSECPNICDRCHALINDGKVQFLSDCSHELAGQTLDLLEIEC